MASNADGDSTQDPNDPQVRKRTGQSASSAHYAEGSGYADAMTKGELAVGQKSGLHRGQSRRADRKAKRGRR